MRPWVIILSSAVLALGAAAAVIRPELSMTPRAALLPSLTPLLPSVAATALAAYALCAIVLTAGDLIEGALRLRRSLSRTPPPGTAGSDWTAALRITRFGHLVPPRAAMQTDPTAADGPVVLQRRFEPHQARCEVARLYYIGAARAHFFSALMILLAGVVLGVAQLYGLPSVLPGPIPTVPAALAVAGLVLIAILGRVAVDVAGEPLIEAISRLPAETAESGFLRRTAELLTAAPMPVPARSESAAAPIAERLSDVLEHGHQALLEAIERLAATTEGLGTTTRASVEALEAAFRAAGQREPTSGQSATLDTAAITDLRDAVAALTAILQHIRDKPVAERDDEFAAAPARREAEPDLARELRKLLQEIETAP